jgi:hypothetical protein
VTDLMYLAIAQSPLYVAVILDAWSRRVVRYWIGRRIDALLALAALHPWSRPGDRRRVVFTTPMRRSVRPAELYRNALTAFGCWAR